MAPRIALALALHNHQPVGNFGWVIAAAHDAAYGPMVEALERHPTVRLALHYSGPLFGWLRTERPEFVERLRALVARGQVELLGGGWYEPVLASLPERDRIGQLTRMADELETTFGRRPRGAWLAERVWEPDVPTSLVAAGYSWTILDDAHFRAATVAEDAMWGPYTTEDQGRLVTVFGTEQGLRYRIPFREVEDVIAYLRDHATEAGERVGMMGDDGEKFGAWPTTDRHCWGEGRWVERFFAALEDNADWLTTVTPSDWLAGHPPIGRLYVPTGSYAEMGGWALPPDEARAFDATFHRALVEELPERRWLRGAIWRNFQVRYREVNDLHKQMLRASDAVAAMPPGPSRDAARDLLYRGQSNDPYWHGLFGGIYLPDLRVAATSALIGAEDLADAVIGALGTEPIIADLDLDGRPEVLLPTAGQVVVLDPDEGSGIGRWDIRAARHPLAAVLRRRPEAYHTTILAGTDPSPGDHVTGGAIGAMSVDPTATDRDAATVAAASIHELVAAKEAGLASRIAYDSHERRSGLILLLPTDATPAAWAAGTAADHDWSANHAEIELRPAGAISRWDGAATGVPLSVSSMIGVGGGRLDPVLTQTVTIVNVTDAPLAGRLGIEWSFMLLGGGGNPAAWWDIARQRSTHDATRDHHAIAQTAQGNDDLGIVIETELSPAADAWIAPIETISNSEAGFERVYQGSGLLFSWLLGDLAPGASVSVAIRHRVAVAVDRAADEGLPHTG